MVPIRVDCGGHSGKYVHVSLPGKNRIAAFSMETYRAKPTLPKDAMVCYAVEARTQTETEPEFIVSSDPMDPGARPHPYSHG